jgi:hypothetical protein
MGLYGCQRNQPGWRGQRVGERGIWGRVERQKTFHGERIACGELPQQRLDFGKFRDFRRERGGLRPRQPPARNDAPGVSARSASHAIPGGHNVSDVTILGDGDLVLSTQIDESARNASGIEVIGSSNTVTLSQTADFGTFGITSNGSQIAVNGDGNQVSVDQTAFGVGGAPANMSSVISTGSGNVVSVVQQ